MHELEKHEYMHKRQRIKFSTTTIPGTGVQPVIMKSPPGLECPTMKVYGRFVEVQRVVLLLSQVRLTATDRWLYYAVTYLHMLVVSLHIVMLF